MLWRRWNQNVTESLTKNTQWQGNLLSCPRHLDSERTRYIFLTLLTILKIRALVFYIIVSIVIDKKGMFFLLPSQGGDCGQWCCGEIFADPEVLQGDFHHWVQEDHRCRLPWEENKVRSTFILLLNSSWLGLRQQEWLKVSHHLHHLDPPAKR